MIIVEVKFLNAFEMAFDPRKVWTSPWQVAQLSHDCKEKASLTPTTHRSIMRQVPQDGARNSEGCWLNADSSVDYALDSHTFHIIIWIQFSRDAAAAASGPKLVGPWPCACSLRKAFLFSPFCSSVENNEDMQTGGLIGY